MKLGIIGSRNFANYHLLCDSIERYFNNTKIITEVVSGGAKGADSLAAKWAQNNNVMLTEYLPDWERFGKIAGFLRNEDIVKNSDVLLVFWDGLSKGTQNSLSIAKRLKKTTIIVYF